MYLSVDITKSGKITEKDWMNYWNSVLRSGHTEDEIRVEVLL